MIEPTYPFSQATTKGEVRANVQKHDPTMYTRIKCNKCNILYARYIVKCSSKLLNFYLNVSNKNSILLFDTESCVSAQIILINSDYNSPLNYL